MDVNQTKFHLLYGAEDWGRCYADGSPTPLAEQWRLAQDPSLAWDAATNTLRLARTLPLFRRASRTPPLAMADRRGADRDGFGNWYWIDEAETGIRFAAEGQRMSAPFWSLADLAASCPSPDDGGFAPKGAPVAPTGRLRGLAVTSRHFLVVGDDLRRGLYVFDLHGGGAPLFLAWPVSTPFAPWDMAALPDGGLLILDRDNLRYWVLDENFRVAAEPGGDEATLFQPADPDADPVLRPLPPTLTGYALAAGVAPGPDAPVSIEPGVDGSVFILDTRPDRDFSLLFEYRGETQLAAWSLENAVTVFDPDVGEGEAVQFSLAAHDFVHRRGVLGETLATDPPPSVLYFAERDGNQVMAFVVDRDLGTLVDRPEFLPLRRWEAKALVRAGDEIFYDFTDRWIALQPLMECQYVGQGVLTTPPTTAGGLFDSQITRCVWHRLLLDAQIPPGTRVAVRARAADDPALIEQMGWLVQPAPYRRANGAELPYYDPWQGEADGDARTGTWELLFQEVTGRYLQVEVTLLGTGRSTPAVRALRAWYPRFSYLDHYLPAIYREEPGPASFLARWLANVEGVFTNIEDKIEHAAALFDPRTAPPETLDWLGCWLGVVLDPLWDETKRRFFIRHADRIYRQRGTVAGVVIALRLYLDAQVDEGIFDPACWATGRVRLVEHFRTRDMGGMVFGDPTGGAPQLRPVTYADVVASAHRFTVMLPHDLAEEDLLMVERLVALEKPAHTVFELKQYWAFFRVGEARLGLDTQLGAGSRFVPVELGRTYLADGYLAAAYPFDIDDRIVVARDRLGDMPAL